MFCILTGATSGLGASFLKILIDKSNYDFIILGRDNVRLMEIKSNLESIGRKCIICSVDFSDANFNTVISNLFNDLDRNIEIDLLINCAATIDSTSFENLRSERLLALINCNIASLTFLTLLSIPFLKKQPSRILNISSVSGFYGIPNYALYSAAKAFLISFSEALSIELSQKSIKVSVFCPGAFGDKALPEYESNFKKIKRLFVSMPSVIKKLLVNPASIAWYISNIRLSKPMNVNNVAEIALNFSAYGKSPIMIYDFRNKFVTYILVIIGPRLRSFLLKKRFY